MLWVWLGYVCLSNTPAFTKNFRSCEATAATFNRAAAGKWDAHTSVHMHAQSYLCFLLFCLSQKTIMQWGVSAFNII